MRCDDLIPAGDGGHGIDVALQRADDLDLASLELIQKRLAAGEPIRALDLAGGTGGHGVRMAKAGADVIVSDILPRNDDVMGLADANNVVNNVSFVQADMADLNAAFPEAEAFDVVVCQRAVHYLPYKVAQQALKNIKNTMSDRAHLYLSASGLLSELGQGYPAKDAPVESRFSKLADEMAAHHNILQSVCLYTEADLRTLLEDAGFEVTKLYSSSFGNIKAIAIKGKDNG